MADSDFSEFSKPSPPLSQQLNDSLSRAGKLNNLQTIPNTTPSPNTKDSDFSEFSKPSSKQAPTAQVPKRVASIFDGADALAGEAYNHLGNSAGKFVGGLANMVAHPINTVEGIGSVLGGAGAMLGERAANGGKALTPSQQASIVADHPFMQSMIDKASAVGGVYADRYMSKPGEPAFSALRRTMATDPVGFAADLSTLFTGGAGVTRAVGKAGLAGKLDTLGAVTNPLNVLKPITKSVGMVANATGVAPALANGVRNITDAALTSPTAVARNVFVTNTFEKPNEIANALNNAGSAVPGYNRTAAQAAANVGSTRFQAAAAQASKNLSTDYGDIQNAQNSALQRQVGRIGGTFDPDQLEVTRNVTGEHNYDISNNQPIKFNDDLLHQLGLPLNKNVLSDAGDLATQEGHRLMTGENIPSHTLPERVTDVPRGKNWTETVIEPAMDVPSEYATMTGKGGQIIKKAFDDIVAKFEKSTSDVAPAKAKAVMGTRQKVLDLIFDQNPAHKVANDAYKALSGQIDRANVRRVLQARLSESPESFINALDSVINEITDSNQLVDKITGKPKLLGSVLTPGEMDLTESVQDELARNARASSDARKGSLHSNDINNAGADTWLPNFLNTGNGALNSLGHFFVGNMDKRLSGEFSNALRTPKGANDLLSTVMAHKAQLDQHRARLNSLRQSLPVRNLNSLYKYGPGALARYPALVNTQDQKNALAK